MSSYLDLLSSAARRKVLFRSAVPLSLAKRKFENGSFRVLTTLDMFKFIPVVAG